MEEQFCIICEVRLEEDEAQFCVYCQLQITADLITEIEGGELESVSH
jgi:hypothetical protein